jgi:phosphatidylinositol alpha-1,6-mannosyltransferase
LLFVGRSDELFAKGQDLLIDIWPNVVSQIPNARLVFVGGGTCLTHLQELARASRAARNIDVLGFVAEADMHAIWRRATAFAMLSFVEGFGLVFVEAMRQGLPVIASTEDASSEINVHGVTGWNISRNDRATLTDRIAFLLRNEEYAHAFGRASLERWRSHFRFSAFSQRLNIAVAAWLRDPNARTK